MPLSAYLNLEREIDIKAQKAFQMKASMRRKESPYHIIVEMSKIQNKAKLFKAVKVKYQLAYSDQNAKITLVINYLTLKARNHIL